MMYLHAQTISDNEKILVLDSTSSQIQDRMPFKPKGKSSLIFLVPFVSLVGFFFSSAYTRNMNLKE